MNPIQILLAVIPLIYTTFFKRAQDAEDAFPATGAGKDKMEYVNTELRKEIESGSVCNPEFGKIIIDSWEDVWPLLVPFLSFLVSQAKKGGILKRFDAPDKKEVDIPTGNT